jgi:IS30 family transposase
VAPHLTVEQKRAVHRLRSRGLSLRAVAREVGCTAPGVVCVLERTPIVPPRPDLWRPGPSRLQMSEREEISLGLLAGLSLTAIAHSLGRSPSTVSREAAANGGASDYRAWRAHQHAYRAARRPKVAKLTHRPLADQVSTWLVP